MAKDVRTLSGRARLSYGLLCIALGCYPIALSFGFFPDDEAGISAPLWVIAGAGTAVVIVGFMILMANHSRINDLLASVLLLLFGIMGVWASLFSSSEGFSGSEWYLSQELNVMLGRWLFGLGSLISFAMCGYAIRRVIRSL